MLAVLIPYQFLFSFIFQVALEHVNADLVVHYGDACMSHIRGIPVYYVFERSTIDIDSCVEAVREKFGGSTKYVCFTRFYVIGLFTCRTIYHSIIVLIRFIRN